MNIADTVIKHTILLMCQNDSRDVQSSEIMIISYEHKLLNSSLTTENLYIV